MLTTHKFLNRHGLIAGATGTGKTTSARLLIEQAVREGGLSIVLADVKGDLSGLATIHDTQFWPSKVTTIGSLQPEDFAVILRLTTEVQRSCVSTLFNIARDKFADIGDLNDFVFLVDHVNENLEYYSETFGKLSVTTLGVIRRQALALQDSPFCARRMDLGAATRDSCINHIDCRSFSKNPQAYTAFVLWVLGEIATTFQEVREDSTECLVVFDEAHLIFEGASRDLIQRISSLLRLVRSKGVGVFFITQSVTDIPALILGQLQNRVQHNLRAYTERDQRAVKAVLSGFRNDLKVALDLQTLGVGEAFVSFIDSSGAPSDVKRWKMALPKSLAPLNPSEVETYGKKLAGYLLQEPTCESVFNKIKLKSSEPITFLKGLGKSLAKTAASTASRQIITKVIRSVIGR